MVILVQTGQECTTGVSIDLSHANKIPTFFDVEADCTVNAFRWLRASARLSITLQISPLNQLRSKIHRPPLRGVVRPLTFR